MPSNDEKKPAQNAGKTEESKALEKTVATGKQGKDGKTIAFAKPKKKLSIGWWFGIIVLILVSISFVLAPTIEAVIGKKQGTGLVFGTYGKEKIQYAYGNYFYDQYQNYANQYKTSSSTNTEQVVYQIWKSAYDSTVLYTALNQMAKKAGIIASSAVVNRRIIDGGYYNVDGKFDLATFNKATTEQKTDIEKSVKESLIPSIVANDVGSVLSSTAEQEYVAAMADNSRTFQYAAFDASLYPDEDAASYAVKNPQLFYSIDLSTISADSKESAQTILDSINNGDKTFEEAALSESKDAYAAKNGKVGKLYFFQISSNFKNVDDAQQLFSAEPGKPFGPVEGPNSWTIYRVDSAPTAPDYADPKLLSVVKTYMALYDSQIITDYLKQQATTFDAEAKSSDDFATAATKAGVNVTDVTATPLNVGGSSYLGSFSNSDPNGVLAYADTDTLKKMYSADEGSVLDPFQAGTTSVVVKVGKESNSGIGSYLKTFYSYLSGANNQQDLAQAVMHSDQFKDNFLTVFLTQILGQGTTSKK
jgi:hypothetical protein